MNKKEQVKSFFEQTDIYFNYDYNVKIRTETVAQFLDKPHYAKVLDMPCGNGSISIQNSSKFGHLFLVDFSENMIALAKELAEKEHVKMVSFSCSDLFTASHPEEAYDLVISLGILAHVDDVDDFLNHIQQKVKKGGSIIIQNTDSKHFYSWFIRFYLGIRRVVGKDQYRLNQVPARKVENSFKKAGFTLENTYRYNQSFVGFSRLFSNEKKYRLTRKWFGDVLHNKNAALGSDYLYHFRKK